MGIHGMNRTVDYYNQHSKEYFEATRSTDMSDLYEAFLPYLHAGGKILDVGCGSGRDLKYFKEHGYEAEGVDASEELCQLASEYSGCKVTCCRMENFAPDKKYAGIWCCASLLHLEDGAVAEFFRKCQDWLAEGGILFLSVKTGISTGEDGKAAGSGILMKVRSGNCWVKVRICIWSRCFIQKTKPAAGDGSG